MSGCVTIIHPHTSLYFIILIPHSKLFYKQYLCCLMFWTFCLQGREEINEDENYEKYSEWVIFMINTGITLLYGWNIFVLWYEIGNELSPISKLWRFFQQNWWMLFRLHNLNFHVDQIFFLLRKTCAGISWCTNTQHQVSYLLYQDNKTDLENM